MVVVDGSGDSGCDSCSNGGDGSDDDDGNGSGMAKIRGQWLR